MLSKINKLIIGLCLLFIFPDKVNAHERSYARDQARSKIRKQQEGRFADNKRYQDRTSYRSKKYADTKRRDRGTSNVDQEILDLEKQIKEKNKRLQKLEFELEDLIEEQIKQLESKIQQIKNQISKLEKKLQALRGKTGRKGGKVWYDLGSGTGKVVIQAYFFDPNNPSKGQDFIERSYTDIRADISDEEREHVSKNRMGSPVYGEILLKSLQQLLQDQSLGLTEGFKKVVGVELAPTRYHRAEEMRKKIEDEGLAIPGRTIEFRNESMATTDFSDADYIYMCSTCFPDELMHLLTQRFSKLKDGVMILTLKPLPDLYIKCGFERIKELTLPMTWSQGSPVYIYKLTKSKIQPECYSEKAPQSDEADIYT